MKHLVIITLVFISYSIYGQDNSNSLFVGGSVGYNRAGNNSTDVTQELTLTPYIGKMINQIWSIGVITQHVRTVDRYDLHEDNKYGKAKTNSYSIGLLTRYTFNPNSSFLFQMEPSLSGLFSRSTIDERNTEVFKSNTTSIAVRITPMISYRVNPKTNLLARLRPIGFEIGKIDIEHSDNVNYTRLDGTLNLMFLQIGIEFFL